MKVRDALGNSSGIANVPVKDGRKVSAGRETDFQNRLRQVEEGSSEQRIEELVNRISRQGEKLGQKVDVGELRIYKKLISEFLDEALGKSRKFSKQSLLDRRGRHKVYALIRKINEELDQLTQDVLSEEKDNIGILQRLTDIRGLILDMVL